MTRRNTAKRDNHRRRIAQGHPPCHLCGGPIDYTLPHTDPMSYVVDHIIPLKHWPEGDVLENKAAAHRIHNEQRGAKLLEHMKPGYIKPVVQPMTSTRTW